MGWTFFHFTGSRTEFIKDHLSSEPAWGTLVDHAVVGTVIYAAVQLGTKHGALAGKITCLIFLTSLHNTEYNNFGYKDMDESAGPCECSCPKRIIKLLSPVEELYSPGSLSLQYATEWRERCNTSKKRREQTDRNAGGTQSQLFKI